MSKITATLMGGLGNQLFQIFAVMAYAIRNGMEFTFQDCEELKIGHVRKTYWETFLKGMKPFLSPRASLKGQTWGGAYAYNEPRFEYTPLPVFNADVILTGYFQSLHYFQDEFDIIMDILEIPEQIKAIKSRFPDIFKGKGPLVSMHFRIGDYKAVQDCHPIVPYEYYRQALGAQGTSTNVLYFNEEQDEQECQVIINRLKTEFPDVTFIHAPPLTEDWEQMLLMACCDVNIIANSTFSWWGAVLSKSKSVYYPVNWFGPKLKATHNIKDLIISTWRGISF